ncbi:MAG TPA: PLP-dependent aminotransferase family protein [Candidatus Sulfomarinibacteraceae bacterium]|nr:PLP-dependent aminotransferase family protein [Candidatus Sulfomarinibacteraceae bacterium]
MDIAIDRASDEPIYRQLIRQIQQMIRSGALPEGFKLPPERRLAAALEVNRSTVLTAYRELKALGLVDAHVGRGTAVLRPPSAPAPPGSATDVPWRQLFRGGAGRSRDPILADLLAMTERDDMVSFSIGLPAPELLPLDTFSALTEELLSEHGTAPLLHTPTEGHTPLRDTLARWLASRGIHTKSSEVVVVSGSQQGLDLLTRIFLDPGDIVVVEEPSYIGALQVFRSAQVRLIGVPVDSEGMRTDILASVLNHQRPKLIYTLPTFQNPSGAVMSIDRRRHLLELAARYQIPIVEDDPYSELRYEGDELPSLKALDENGLVIYLSTFSKVLLPGLRIGYVVAPPVVQRQLVLAKQGADLHSNSFGQYLIDRFMRGGHFAAHIDMLKSAYRRRRDVMVAALGADTELALDVQVPDGGFYIWCGIPDGVNQSALMASAVERGVGFLPGQACFAGEPPVNALRLNFTHCAEESIDTGIGRLLAALREANSVARRPHADSASTSPVV